MVAILTRTRDGCNGRLERGVGLEPNSSSLEGWRATISTYPARVAGLRIEAQPRRSLTRSLRLEAHGSKLCKAPRRFGPHKCYGETRLQAWPHGRGIYQTFSGVPSTATSSFSRHAFPAAALEPYSRPVLRATDFFGWLNALTVLLLGIRNPPAPHERRPLLIRRSIPTQRSP